MSIPGSYTGFGQGGIDRFGLCRLGEIINGEGWVAAKGERVVVEYQVCHSPPTRRDETSMMMMTS